MTVDAQGGGGDGSRGEKRKADDCDIDAEMLMGQLEFEVIEERDAEAWVCEINKKVEEETDDDLASEENEVTDDAADTFSAKELVEAWAKRSHSWRNVRSGRSSRRASVGRSVAAPQ